MTEMDNNSKVEIVLPDSVDNAIKNLTDKPTQTIGQIISDCLYWVFGGISQKAEIKRVKYANELEKFRKDLEGKIDEVPEEDRLEPNVHTVCTALESMRYCVEEKELREMFATLIANSLDIKTATFVHPSYGEIIKQLTPYDARLIIWMKGKDAIPVIRFHIDNKGNNTYRILPTVYIEYCDDNMEMIQVSLENLSRLKIIDLKLDLRFADKEKYERIKSTQKYLNDRAIIEDEMEEDKELKEVYGSIEITQFGKHFMNSCC